MVDFLRQKFADKSSKYIVREISKEELNEARNDVALKVFKTIDGSSLFQVVSFTPFSPTIKAAMRLCLCDLCKVEYGSCTLFQEYELSVQILKETSLRSSRLESNSNEIVDTNTDFLLPGSFCAIAADNNSADTVCFVLIDREIEEARGEAYDDYGHKVALGQKYLCGRFLESEGDC